MRILFGQAEWSIQPEQIVLRKRLGQGEFGEVWAGLLKGVGEHSGLVAKVAVKKLKDERLHEGFLAEVILELVWLLTLAYTRLNSYAGEDNDRVGP